MINIYQVFFIMVIVIFCQGDLAGWQGDGSSIGFPPHLNFSTSESSSQQNAPGVSVALNLLPFHDLTSQ